MKVKTNKISRRISRLLGEEFEHHSYFSEAYEKNIQKRIKDKNANFKIIIESGILEVYEKIIIKRREESDNQKRYSMLLIKQYIKSNFLISLLLSGNEYFDSALLIRKQLETVTRLVELERKSYTKLLKKTPNIQNIFKSTFNDMKSELSEYTHVSSLDKLEKLNKINKGYRSRYNKKMFSKFNIYLVHCHVMMLAVLVGISNKYLNDPEDVVLNDIFIPITKHGIKLKILRIE